MEQQIDALVTETLRSAVMLAAVAYRYPQSIKTHSVAIAQIIDHLQRASEYAAAGDALAKEALQ